MDFSGLSQDGSLLGSLVHYTLYILWVDSTMPPKKIHITQYIYAPAGAAGAAGAGGVSHCTPRPQPHPWPRPQSRLLVHGEGRFSGEGAVYWRGAV